MKQNHHIDTSLFVTHRQQFTTMLKPSSIAIFNSNDLMPTNADGHMAFVQNSDLYYLTGIMQEETILVLCPDAPLESKREMLFIKHTNEHTSIWEGEKLSTTAATAISGIKNVHYLHDFEVIVWPMIFGCEYLYLNINEHTRAHQTVPTRDERFIHTIKQKFPLHKLERSAPIMHRIRSIKHDIEIQLIKKAIDVTKSAFERVAKTLKPNMAQYEIEAEITHEFIKNACNHAFLPIIASGKDTCVLHYIENNKTCRDGDLLLLDFGANFAGYNADVTRVLPISGKFSPRQSEVYASVLDIQKYAITQLVSGNDLVSYQKSVEKYVETQLIKLGLLTQSQIDKQDENRPLYKKYFMHSISHFLGLDVHDVGSSYSTFVPGMVLTCEPGIYIRDENIGIRLENNILILEKGNLDLTSHIPIEIADIEAIMAKH